MANTDNPSPSTPVQQQLTRVRDPQYRDLYSNATMVGMTPFDLTVTFQRNGEIAPGIPGSVDLVGVSMSPQNLKALIRVLSETFSAYEKVFGQVAIPDQDTRPTSDAIRIEAQLQEARSRVAAQQITASSNGPPQPSAQSHAASPGKGKQP